MTACWQVDHIISKIIEESGFSDPAIVATGGLASGIEQHSRYIKHIDPTLTLEGLRLIADSN
jgi:type III pantothenate kinase